MSFVSLTAPLQLHGHYITLFWASEAVLLYWLFLKSQIRLIRLASFLVWIAMLISLLMDWDNIYQPVLYGKRFFLPVVFNKGYLTGLYSAISCWVLFRLDQKGLRAKSALLIAGLLLLSGGLLEIAHQFHYYYPDINVALLYILVYTYLVIIGFALYIHRLKEGNFALLGAGLLTINLIVYLFALPAYFNIQRNMLESDRYRPQFFAHWAGAVLIAVVLFRLITAQKTGKLKAPPELFTWLACLVTVVFVSAEGQLLVNGIYYSPLTPLDELQRVYDKTGLPILWGLCSFAFMWLGMRHKFKTLRIISLVLFSITLLKLFLFDIRNIPVAGKIAAFFCLGVLLLVVSFMYQRLKKIIIEDEEKKTV
jgi:hypothetical protein